MNIREFNYKLTETINNCGLPIDIIELTLEKLLAEVRLAVERAIAQETKKQEELEEKQESEVSDESE